MHDTHRGMNINEAEYMATIDDILGALRKIKSMNKRKGRIGNCILIKGRDSPCVSKLRLMFT